MDYYEIIQSIVMYVCMTTQYCPPHWSIDWGGRRRMEQIRALQLLTWMNEWMKGLAATLLLTWMNEWMNEGISSFSVAAPRDRQIDDDATYYSLSSLFLSPP